MEDKINGFLKASGVNVEPFWPGLFAKALASVNTGSLICSVGGWWASSIHTAAAPAEEKKIEAKKEESEESEDDTGFGLFD